MTLSHGSPGKIRLAISTCPNDTFAFHGILERKVDWQGLDFEIQLLDIQQLNDGLFNGQFDVAKASFHAAGLLSDRTVVLPSGSALGFGVGPLLLAARADHSPADIEATEPSTVTLSPGTHTTAAMLFQLFYGDAVTAGKTRVKHLLFSEIMPALKKSEADFGVCIHEGRFTWEQEGLFLVEDLGTRWEGETGGPLPLGGILACRSLGDEVIGKIQSVIRSSVEYGMANRHETLSTMRKYAQEFSDDVLFAHVDLYVNQWTVDLGRTGREALAALSQKMRIQEMVATGMPGIQVWNGTGA